LIVTNTYTPIVGGVERSIKSFTNEYKKRGHKVLILTLKFAGDYPEEGDIIRLPSLRRFNGSDFSVRLPIPVNLKDKLKAFKPDIVHSHHPFMLGDTALRIANQFQIPIVFTYHTKYEDYTHYVPLHFPQLKKFVKELCSGYAALTDYVFAPSETIANMLIERGVKRPVQVIPTGIDTTSFAKGDRTKFRKQWHIPNNSFVIGHVGRLAPEKNLVFLTKAVIAFLKNNSNAYFTVIGKGPSQEEMQKLLQQTELINRVRFIGILEKQELIDAYHAMDVFAFSSHTETQGLVLVEAMACGIPVVALNASGVREVLKDKINGRMIEHEDPQAFQEALQWIADQKSETYDILQQSARETADSFSIEKSVDKALNVYTSLIQKPFVYSDIENSLWTRSIYHIRTEWNLATNVADAATEMIKERFNKRSVSIISRILHWLNPYEWSAKILGFYAGTQKTDKGLVMIQIDGLSMSQCQRAIKEGRMPFMQSLLRKGSHQIHPFYSGQPSSTPGVQGELFYGIKTAVPAFSFVDKESSCVFKMFDDDAAIIMEKRLSAKQEGLFHDGIAYSNIYSGGAKEAHFCATNLGWNHMLRSLKLRSCVGLFLVNLGGLLQTVFLILFEFFFSSVDFMVGLLKKNSFRKEFKFIPTRLFITILLRELIAFGARVDIARGFPIIHLNLLGYDEHAHRRGPSSKFAHWTLPGIDWTVSRIFRAAQESTRRSYQVWIYSDHGQEECLSYTREQGHTVHKAIDKLLTKFSIDKSVEDDYLIKGIQSQRALFLGKGVFNLCSPFGKRKKLNVQQKNVVVTAMGPLGHVYMPEPLTWKDKAKLADKLVNEAHIPLVFVLDEDRQIHAFNSRGQFMFPKETGEVLGQKHPYLKEVTNDVTRICLHANAGTFIISGWRPEEISYSFPIESGSHGGPGYEETSAFALLPQDQILPSHKKYFRAYELRDRTLRYLGRNIIDKTKNVYAGSL